MAYRSLKGLSDGLWCTFGRLMICVGMSLALLAPVLRIQANLLFFSLIGLFTAALIGVNAVGLVRGQRHNRWVEFGSMVCGLGAISCLVLATGGPEGPLLPLFLLPVFVSGFRSGPRAAYTWAAVNSLVLVVMVAHSPSLYFSAQRLLGPLVVMGLMWLEAYTVDVVVRRIVLQREELMQLARRDPLTGLLNRRSLYELLSRLMAEGKEFTVILVDLDRFKATNDKHGHLFGDEVLKRMAEAMQRAVRRDDAVARYGGDEFAVVVRGNREEGECVMLRLQEAVAVVSCDMNVDVGLSGGVAEWPTDGATVEELMQVADRRLYDAKGSKCGNRPNQPGDHK